MAEGDRLSLVGALEGFDPMHSAITDFVQIVSAGKDSLLMVDYNGKAWGSSFDWVAAKLEGVTGLTDERALQLSGNLLV